ncbi:hypothetical protein A0H81_12985 [Grifola frondosa]|uniref:Smr domain-containing protein n=1 Tax=Grifola frondosa TaxID=5627 RepID=A0A1C7LQV7_GRIFR|nr:hypothetical protein A0H81_12985 [Grifola frondosa]
MGLFVDILNAVVNFLCANTQEQPRPPPAPDGRVQYTPQVSEPSVPSYPVTQQPVSARPPTQPHKPHPHHTPSPGPRRQDANQINQNNEHYKGLRARANEEGDQMAQCFEQAHQAYAAGDGARAKELSNEGKAHQREMERLNAQASEWIFVENNKDSQSGEIDLHGLYVKEAITFTEKAIQEARGRGESKVHLIVGKGLHSANGVAKLKPAIEELMQKQGLVAELDQSNGGVLIVNLDGQPSGEGTIMRPDDIARGLANKDEGCLIM